MNFLFFVAISCILASASADQTCDECKEYADKFVEVFFNDENVMTQVEMMITVLCPMSDLSHEDCVEEVTNKWPAIVELLFPRFLNSDGFCGFMGLCSTDNKMSAAASPFHNSAICNDCDCSAADGVAVAADDVDCNVCQSDIYSMGGYLLSKSDLPDMIDFLKGEAYCGATDNVAECQTRVENYLPMVIEELADMCFIRAQSFCCDMYSSCCTRRTKNPFSVKDLCRSNCCN
jgi:hypothetical protein